VFLLTNLINHKSIIRSLNRLIPFLNLLVSNSIVHSNFLLISDAIKRLMIKQTILEKRYRQASDMDKNMILQN
jgi:hypothetical protein